LVGAVNISVYSCTSMAQQLVGKKITALSKQQGELQKSKREIKHTVLILLRIV